ncbi:Ntr2 [Kluyveromyces lactis]|nr:Ntr2 [Kluyveromyces lactis]
MVKIKLPDLESDEDVDLIGTSINKAATSISDEETEEPLAKPLKFKLKRNKQVPLVEEYTNDDEYSTLFEQPAGTKTRNSKETINVLNLEDLEGSEEEQNEAPKYTKKVRNRSQLISEKKVNEKTYVKLLSNQDKDDLRELGITAQSDIYAEEDDQLLMDNSLQDERLALGDKEKQLMQQRKRKEIEQLINLHDEETVLPQEMQELDKISGQKTVLLPRLQPEQKWEDIYQELSEYASSQRDRDTLNSKRIEILSQQLQDLTLKKEALLEEMKHIASSHNHKHDT